MRLAATLFALGSSVLWSQTSTQASLQGSIQGTVSDTQNQPIAGALVIITQTFKTPKEVVAPYHQSVKTDSDGSFLAQGLPPGTYSYCAQVPGDGYLNGCQWSTPMPAVALAAGQKLRTAIRVGKGSILKVRVLDPGHIGLGQSHDRKTPPILMGVWDSRGHFLPVHPVGRDSDGFNYQLTVPLDTPLNFHIVASKLTLSDATGVALPASLQAPGVAASASLTAFQHSSGDPNPKSFQFTITGVSR
jgi:hypothetical protein